METKRKKGTSKRGKSVKDLPVNKKTGRKVKGGTFELNDYGFGVTMPVTTSSSSSSTTTKK